MHCSVWLFRSILGRVVIEKLVGVLVVVGRSSLLCIVRVESCAWSAIVRECAQEQKPTAREGRLPVFYGIHVLAGARLVV